MKRLQVILAVAALAICVATAVCADTIDLSENWYIRITDFSVGGSTGFHSPYTYQWSTTHLIEAKLLDQVPNTETYSTLLFDFHAGQAQTGDEADLLPYAALASDWSAEISFDWRINCDDPRVAFRFWTPEVSPYDATTWWSIPTGTGIRSGTASFHAGTILQVPPSFQLSLVPEPQSLVALVIPTLIVGMKPRFWRRRS